MSEEVILDITTVDETVTIDTTAPDVVQINVLAVTGGATTWDQIEDKPTEFPPAAHTQGWGTLTGTVDIVPFTTTNGGPTATGELAWLASTESLALRLANGENLDIGEENVYHVDNNTGSTITKGTAVSYAGTVGGSGKIRVKPWNGSTDAPEAFMGFAMGAIASGEAGYVTAFGVIRGVNTSAFSDGVILYANPSGTGLTATKPTTTHVIACLCVNASNNGTILVRPTVDKITGWDDVTGKPTEYTPAPHTHGNITNDGRIGTTADLVTVTGPGGVLTTASRSGIDSRTSFPNADVAAATDDSIAGTIVKRSVDNVVGLNTVELSGFGGIIGVGNNVQISLQAANSIIETQFGNSPIQTLHPTSNIITRGSFVLNGGTNTITLSGTPTANRTITVPDASGTLALISTAGQNFLNSPTSANLATLLTDENGTGGGFVRAEGATLTSPSLVGTPNFAATNYTYGAGAALAHRTALSVRRTHPALDDGQQNDWLEVQGGRISQMLVIGTYSNVQYAHQMGPFLAGQTITAVQASTASIINRPQFNGRLDLNAIHTGAFNANGVGVWFPQITGIPANFLSMNVDGATKQIWSWRVTLPTLANRLGRVYSVFTGSTRGVSNNGNMPNTQTTGYVRLAFDGADNALKCYITTATSTTVTQTTTGTLPSPVVGDFFAYSMSDATREFYVRGILISTPSRSVTLQIRPVGSATWTTVAVITSGDLGWTYGGLNVSADGSATGASVSENNCLSVHEAHYAAIYSV